MAGVSYFQRYSQPENHVTNNTLLVLRHLYQHSPLKLEAVLNDLLGGGPLTLGPEFHQQIKGVVSVPDAAITQSPLSLYVETKLGTSLESDQIERHLTSIDAKDPDRRTTRYLIGLTTMPLSAVDAQRLGTTAAEKGVIFRSVTFSTLVKALRDACETYESDLRSIVDDYIDFIQGMKLLHDRDDWLIAFSCGVSFEENRRFCLYYCSPQRPRRQDCKFIGIYKDKAISLVGEIRAVMVCAYDKGTVRVVVEQGAEEPWMKDRILGVIETTTYYDLKSNPQRFYLADRLAPTNLRKTSFGGLREMQHIKLPDLLGSQTTPGELGLDVLAERLRDATF